jgi:Fic family protein
MTAVAHQVQDAEARVRQLRRLRDTYRKAVIDENAPSRIYTLIDHLFAHPAITAELAAEALSVTKPTARAYIDRLVQMGALEEVDRNHRKLWLAPKILELIETPLTAEDER